jgi:hypothetical protein
LKVLSLALFLLSLPLVGLADTTTNELVAYDFLFNGASVFNEYDRESVEFGACVQAYICTNLHQMSMPGETLVDVEDSIEREFVSRLSHEATGFCRSQ